MTDGMVVVSSKPNDDEATATAGILISKIHSTIYALGEKGICMLADFDTPDELEVADCAYNARCVVVILSAGSLEDVQQIKTITYAMMALSDAPAADDSGSRTITSSSTTNASVKIDVIPVCVPGFQFPSAGYFDLVLPKVWPGGRRKARPMVQALFKRIAVPFAVDQSDEVIGAQAQSVLERVPKGKINKRGTTKGAVSEDDGAIDNRVSNNRESKSRIGLRTVV